MKSTNLARAAHPAYSGDAGIPAVRPVGTQGRGGCSVLQSRLLLSSLLSLLSAS